MNLSTANSFFKEINQWHTEMMNERKNLKEAEIEMRVNEEERKRLEEAEKKKKRKRTRKTQSKSSCLLS